MVINAICFKKFIEFECLGAEGRDSDKADIRLYNKAALRSNSRGKHKTSLPCGLELA
jgi:hypothetical protein